MVDNETNRANNVLTIDKGTKHGIKPCMGVISAIGVVGKVRFCSENYSVVTSILHSQIHGLLQTRLRKEIGYAKWLGKDPNFVDLIDVSKYTKVFKGDSAVTSGPELGISAWDYGWEGPKRNCQPESDFLQYRPASRNGLPKSVICVCGTKSLTCRTGKP